MANNTGKKFGGRQKGSLNKVTLEVKELAQNYGEKAIKELARIAFESKLDATRIVACKELLDRGYGKSPQFIETSMPDDYQSINELDLARRIAYLMTNGTMQLGSTH